MAGYAMTALVTDGDIRSLVNVTAIDLVGMSRGGGSSEVHCEECNRVGFNMITGSVNRFIVGVNTDVLVTNLKVIFDVWKR